MCGLRETMCNWESRRDAPSTNRQFEISIGLRGSQIRLLPAKSGGISNRDKSLETFWRSNKAATGYVRRVTRSVATSAAAQTKLKLNHAFRRSARPSFPNLRCRLCEALDRT